VIHQVGTTGAATPADIGALLERTARRAEERAAAGRGKA
jgi:hypothetical protein